MLRGVIAAVLAGVCLGPSSADDLLLSQLYGSGVHLYFAGDAGAAEQSFARAIQMGSTDPRCYYYRGLSLLRTGQEKQAAEAFSKGAALESTQTDRIYSISRALERVQGPERLALERYRIEARRAAQVQRDAERARRYRRMVEQMPRPAARGTDVIPPEVAPEDMPSDDTARSRGTAPRGAPPAARPASAPAEAPPMPADDEADPFAESGDEPMDEMPADDMPADEAPEEDAPGETPPSESEGEADPFADPGAR